MELKIDKCIAMKSFRKGKGRKTLSFIKGKEYKVVGETNFYYSIMGEDAIVSIHKSSFNELFSVYHPDYSHELGRVATAFEVDLHQELKFIQELLVSKNRKYGDSALNPIRVCSKSDAVEQINVRIDDKLSRLKSMQKDEDEDVTLDLIGYFLLKRIALKRLKDGKK